MALPFQSMGEADGLDLSIEISARSPTCVQVQIKTFYCEIIAGKTLGNGDNSGPGPYSLLPG